MAKEAIMCARREGERIVIWRCVGWTVGMPSLNPGERSPFGLRKGRRRALDRQAGKVDRGWKLQPRHEDYAIY